MHNHIMAINLDKPHLWKQDTQTSGDYYNKWFLKFAPKAFRETRLIAVEEVKRGIIDSKDMQELSPGLLHDYPGILPTLRMSCCPPLAVDRLVGLAGVSKNLVESMEAKKLPTRMPETQLLLNLKSITKILIKLLDPDVFVWIPERRHPTAQERLRASTIVADRLTGAVANPIIKNAQEKRQLQRIAGYLKRKGYSQKAFAANTSLDLMPPGTFTFHYAVPTGNEAHRVDVSVDVLVQPHRLRANRLPIFIEAKSAGDFTNTNKRRKEEAKKISQLKQTYGDGICYLIFLCGYFDSGYLGYEAAEGIDWVWEHRLEDFGLLGI